MVHERMIELLLELKTAEMEALAAMLRMPNQVGRVVGPFRWVMGIAELHTLHELSVRLPLLALVALGDPSAAAVRGRSAIG
jgi:hypothetical protein